jgi:hypothetical protein
VRILAPIATEGLTLDDLDDVKERTRAAIGAALPPDPSVL